MATITICEYATLPNFGGIIPQIAQEPCIATKTYAIGASSAQSDAFSAGTQYIWIDVDAICRFEVGPNPTALVGNTGAKTGSKRIQAGTILFVGVTPAHKIAFIADV